MYMKHSLEELMAIAYDATRDGVAASSMRKNSAINESAYTMEFKVLARPYNNRTPRPAKRGGTVMSDCAGYKQLSVWINFGDSEMWKGPDLHWSYQDNSMGCVGPSEQGDESNLEDLARCAATIREENKRIRRAEREWLKTHDSLEGLTIEGYYDRAD
jgi:hypothetical protein